MTGNNLLNLLREEQRTKNKEYPLEPVDVSRCVKILKGLWLRDGTVARVLEEFPRVIVMNDGEIQRKIQFFMGIGIPENSINRIFHSLLRILGFGIEDRLKPLLSEFLKLGFAEKVVRWEISREPWMLGEHQSET